MENYKRIILKWKLRILENIIFPKFGVDFKSLDNI